MSSPTHTKISGDELRSRLRTSHRDSPKTVAPLHVTLATKSHVRHTGYASYSVQQKTPRKQAEPSRIFKAPIVLNSAAPKPANTTPVTVVKPQPYAQPAHQRLQPSKVLKRQIQPTQQVESESVPAGLPLEPAPILETELPQETAVEPEQRRRKLGPLRASLLVFACLALIIGVGAGVQFVLSDNASSAAASSTGLGQ